MMLELMLALQLTGRLEYEAADEFVRCTQYSLHHPCWWQHSAQYEIWTRKPDGQSRLEYWRRMTRLGGPWFSLSRKERRDILRKALATGFLEV